MLSSCATTRQPLSQERYKPTVAAKPSKPPPEKTQHNIEPQKVKVPDNDKTRPSVDTHNTKITLLFPVQDGRVVSRFGWRGGRFHRGVDIAAPVGTKVRAVESGTVVAVGKHKYLLGYGRTILLGHKGNLFTYYAHLNTISVTPGQTIDRGQPIGAVGNTGNSRGPHLHLELVINKRNTDPVPYFTQPSRFKLWISDFKRSVELSHGFRFLLGR